MPRAYRRECQISWNGVMLTCEPPYVCRSSVRAKCKDNTMYVEVP